MMEERQRQTLAELKNPRYISTELVKACIKVVNCNAKLGNLASARQAVSLTSQLGTVPGIPALCQAMISGVKAQLTGLSPAIVQHRLQPANRDAIIKTRNKRPDLTTSAQRRASW